MIIQRFFSILNDYLMFSMTLDNYHGPGTSGTRDLGDPGPRGPRGPGTSGTMSWFH